VIVSNRGHESITIFRVNQGCGGSKGNVRGTLSQVGFFHTRGETPRHFQFDGSGQFLIVANQDSDKIAIFSFNMTSGEIKYTGNEYKVPSPNFVCCCAMVDRYLDDNDNQPYDTFGHIVPSSVVFDQTKKDSVDSELEAARAEIVELKKKLSRVAQVA